MAVVELKIWSLLRRQHEITLDGRAKEQDETACSYLGAPTSVCRGLAHSPDDG